MSQWPLKELGELISFRGGGTPSKDNPEYWGEDISWATVKDFKGLALDKTKDSISIQGLESSSANLIPAGHVIIPTRMALGKAAINTIDLAINQDLRALLPQKPLSNRYLLHAILGLKDQIEANSLGATVKGITQDKLKKLRVPYPPFEEQKRIAKILDAADALRAKRRESLAQLDALLQSTFLDIFGDPSDNPKGFPTRCLSEFFVDSKHGAKCGPFGSALKKSEIVESGVPVWNMDNIDPSGVALMPFRMWVTADKYEGLKSYSVKKGDVLISRAGTVGKMCVAEDGCVPSIISTNLIRLRLSKGLSPQFFVSLMTYCKGRVGRLKTGPDGAFTHMNTGTLNRLTFPYPAIEIQRKYDVIAKGVRKEKELLLSHLTALDKLFEALQQKAFSGEL